MDVYRPTGEGYMQNLYETAKEFYAKFLKGSREMTESLLGSYDSDGSSAKYMKRMPPKGHRVQEYFS